jgi:mRNA-degrading endonuclease toxin of MazEF toxin-antitoxin module
MSGVDFAPGEIVLVRHRPLDDPSAEKKRPALVVSNHAANLHSADIIIVPLSSVIRSQDSSQIVINDTVPFFRRTGLKVTSAIKCASLMAYPKSMVIARLGSVPQQLLDQVRERIRSLFT